MPRPVAGNVVGLVVGVVLLLVFIVPFFLIGGTHMLRLAHEIREGTSAFPGGRPAARVLLGFVLTVPVAGFALVCCSLMNLARRR